MSNSQLIPFVSQGLVIIDPVTTEAKILFVRGARTYAADSLIAGRDYYDANLLKDSKFAKYFADCMSIMEKTKFLQDFNDPEHKMFHGDLDLCYGGKLSRMRHADRNMFVKQCRDAYLASMRILVPYLTESLNSKIDGALPWSFPKGRARPGERKYYRTDLDHCIGAALRETYEETHVTTAMLSVQSQMKPFCIDYCDMGSRYKFNLYYAIPKSNFAFQLDQSDADQMNEVSAIKWFTREQLGAEPLCDVTRAQLYEKFDAIIQHYKDQLQMSRAFNMSSMLAALYGPGAKPAVLVQASSQAVGSSPAVEQKSNAGNQQHVEKVKVALYIPPRRIVQCSPAQKPISKQIIQQSWHNLANWRSTDQ